MSRCDVTVRLLVARDTIRNQGSKILMDSSHNSFPEKYQSTLNNTVPSNCIRTVDAHHEPVQATERNFLNSCTLDYMRALVPFIHSSRQVTNVLVPWCNPPRLTPRRAEIGVPRHGHERSRACAQKQPPEVKPNVHGGRRRGLESLETRPCDISFARWVSGADRWLGSRRP